MSGFGWGGGGTFDIQQITRKTRKNDAQTQAERQIAVISKTPNGAELGKLLQELPAHTSRKKFVPIIQWLEKANKGEKVTLVSIICPDYSTCIDPQSQQPTYTFNGLGTNVGLVAQRALEAHIKIWEFAKALGLEIEFILAMSDQEANEVNCARVGLSHEEFLARLRASQETLHAQVPKGMIVHTPFLTEMAPKAWQECLRKGHKLTDDIRENPRHKQVRAAIAKRGKFYSRWAGKTLSEDEIREMLLAQIPEYIGAAMLIRDTVQNPFILGADSVDMEPFMRMACNETPLLYLERPSY